jgi:hypothetical protein
MRNCWHIRTAPSVLEFIMQFITLHCAGATEFAGKWQVPDGWWAMGRFQVSGITRNRACIEISLSAVIHPERDWLYTFSRVRRDVGGQFETEMDSIAFDISCVHAFMRLSTRPGGLED